MPRFVVLGTGPTGLFAADWIRQHLDTDVVAVGTAVFGALRAAEFDGRATTVMPVFPSIGQSFPEVTQAGPALLTAHVGVPEVPPDRPVPSPMSYAARALRDFAPASVSLALKQFGPRMWRESMLEVQRKVLRSYTAAPEKPVARLGYIAGESPYAHTLRQIIRNLHVMNHRAIAISDRREVIIDDGTRLPYSHLVNTLPLPIIAQLLNAPEPDGTFGGAEFAIAKITPTGSSRLVYDLDAGTPIFRVLTPHEDLAIAQLSMQPPHASPEALVDARRRRLEQLLDVAVMGFHKQAHSVPLAYPLDPPSDDKRRVIDEVCAANHVINLGRFAEWLYVDLHEIKWEARLGCL